MSLPSTTAPLVSDVGASPPNRSSGRWLAVAAASALASLPTVLAFGAVECLRGPDAARAAGRRAQGAALGGAAALLVVRLGRWLVAGLRPAWHDGLSLKTNALMFVLFNLKVGGSRTAEKGAHGTLLSGGTRAAACV